MARLRLTAVVPTYNRRQWVLECVRSLLAQERPLDEIVVVDNGSTDGTFEALRRERVRAFCETARGVDKARNRGIAEATGDVILFLDDDCLAPRHWSAALERPFADAHVAAAGGPTRPLWESAPPPALLASRRSLSYIGIVDFGKTRRPLDPEREFLIGANMAARRSALGDGFRGVFPFPPTGVCAEDTELSRRLARDHEVLWTPDAWVHHRVPAYKTRPLHLMMRGFYFSAAQARMRSAAPRAPLTASRLLREGGISLANAAGRLAAAILR